MYRFVSLLIYLIVAVYICTFLLVYLFPLFDFQFIKVEIDNEMLNISNGDSVLIYPKSFDEIKQGDIIAFSQTNKDIDIKQVVSKSDSTKTVTVLVKEHKIKDLTKVVLYKDVLGVKVINLPKAQVIINFLNNFIGKMFVAIFAGIFLILRFGLGGRKKGL
ncbi:MAG TPA: hypothetical protein VFD25_00565 [Clostridia bacterium]|nr:hypothetical protein [Clostridia bacterium]